MAISTFNASSICNPRPKCTSFHGVSSSKPLKLPSFGVISFPRRRRRISEPPAAAALIRPRMITCSSTSCSSKGGSGFTSSPEPAAALTSFAGDALLLIGLTYNTAPVETREKLAVPESENGRAVEEICRLNHVGEAAILSTCNRVEVYVVALSMQQALTEVTQWMAKRSGIDVSELKGHLFTRRGSDAVHHLFRVSAGLDSVVLGESQILAQVKQVARIGNACKGHGKIMTLLFNRAIEVGKQVRNQTGISSGSVSVSASAVDLALSKLLPAADFRSARVLVVGAGKTGRLLIKHLVSRGSKRIVVVNRSEEKVDAIRKELKGASVDLIDRPTTQLVDCAAEADVVFTCTSSETPLFLKRDVEALPPLGDSVRRLFVDISVPRNVGSCVSEAVGVARVLDVDDLKEAMEANLEKRRGEVIRAESIIGENLTLFGDAFNSLKTVSTLKKLRSYVERIGDEETERCLARLGDDAPPEVKAEVAALSRRIVKKLLDGPMKHLKCSTSEHRTLEQTIENMNVINRMYSLDHDSPMLE